MRWYLDANATEPIRPAARAAVIACLDAGAGNPASVHAAGRAARQRLEDARDTIARRFGAAARGVVFCSGGTEANALALYGLAGVVGCERRVIVGATEHDAVRSAAPGTRVIPVDRDGVLRVDALAALLGTGERALVCAMLANNETGTIQPIGEIAALCRRHGALLHVDAVQAAGRMAVSLTSLGAHSLAVSAHKLGGPPGVGALVLDAEIEASLRPLMRGGGQERGRRGGTPALPAIAGFAAATGEAAPDLTPLRDAIEAVAMEQGAVVAGAGAARLGNTSCLILPGVAAQTQLMALDLAGIAVSAGAACSSGKVAASHVLDAMGYGAAAGQAIRVSLPWNATDAYVEAFAAAYRAMAGRAARAA